MNWYIAVLKQYAVFSGRARRKEYWMFTLVNLIILFLLELVAGFVGAIIGADLSILFILYMVAIMLPSIAVQVRRLHDTDSSGCWLFIGLIPIIGWIALFIFYVQDSTPGENEYGANPKETAA